MTRFHLTPEGVKHCDAHPDQLRGRACRYGSHFENLALAEAAYGETFGGSVPIPLTKPVGPPVPEKFYHVTTEAGLNPVLNYGLQPAVGERSTLLGEDAPRVYLFDSQVSAEAAVGGWLGDEFDEDEELFLLEVDPKVVDAPKPTYVYEDAEGLSGFGPSTEWTTEGIVPPAAIKFLGNI